MIWFTAKEQGVKREINGWQSFKLLSLKKQQKEATFIENFGYMLDIWCIVSTLNEGVGFILQEWNILKFY